MLPRQKVENSATCGLAVIWRRWLWFAIWSTSSEEWQGSTKAWCWKVLERCVVIKSVEQTWCQVTLAATVRQRRQTEKKMFGVIEKIFSKSGDTWSPDVGKAIYHRRRHWIGGAPSYGLKPSEDEIHSLDLRSYSDTSSCMSRDISDVEIAAELGAKTGAVPEPSKRFGVWDPHENPGHRPNDRNPRHKSV